RRDVDAMPRRKSDRRLRRRSVRRERGRCGRAVDDLLEIRLPLRRACDADREAARRAERFDRRFGREAMLAQLLLKGAADLLRERRQPGCRQLLASDLDQKLAIHDYATTSGAVSSTYAFAIATASSRTRRMNAVRSATPRLLLASRTLNT